MDRRRQLLDVALELFDEKGIRGASMRELARRAGVQVALPYHYFDSKRAIIRALFEELGYLDPFREALADDVLDVFRRASPEDALTLLMEASWEVQAEGARWFRLIHVEVLHGDADAIAVGLEMWELWGQQIRAVLEAAGIGAGFRGRRVAEFLRAYMWGVFNEVQLTGETPDARRRRARETARLLLPALADTEPPGHPDAGRGHSRSDPTS